MSYFRPFLLIELLKHLSKPLSQVIVRIAKKRPFVKKYVVKSLGYWYFWCESKILVVLPQKQIKRRPPSDEDRLTEIGARMLFEVARIAGSTANVARDSFGTFVSRWRTTCFFIGLVGFDPRKTENFNGEQRRENVVLGLSSDYPNIRTLRTAEVRLGSEIPADILRGFGNDHPLRVF